MKVILVPVADRPECLVALNAAFDIGARLNANVIGCHVRPHRRESTGESSRRPLVPDEWVNVVAELNPEQIELRCHAAKILFETKASEYGFSLLKKPRLAATHAALWNELVGTPARVMSVIGPLSDLIVMARPGPRDRGKGKAFLLAALMQAAQPVLVIPRGWTGSIGTRVMIAWNQSAEAANAVSSSRSILRNAKDVIITSCGKEYLAGPKSSHLVNFLKLLGIKARRQSTPGKDVIKEIETEFRRQTSDLLVMGGYSRGRTRELILGGLTEHMLFHCEIPVLLLHR
jgi:nucleotide-binding universal stress UspA family protein